MKIKINVLNKNIIMQKEIIDAVGGDELIARIFYNRGYKEPGIIRQMLDDRLYRPTAASEFPFMENAVERIALAISRTETIAVYGDYDVDGVTGTAVLVECLRSFSEKVVYHVPDRFTEGYGMNEQVIKTFAKKGVGLVITCDCGISNHNEISLAKSLGMDVIVTDHHNIPEVLPTADVVLNPKLLEEGHRARNISGCCMAYFLCLALLRNYGCDDKADDFLDLLALSLVADVVSLNGENRYLLKRSLPKLFNTGRIGLKALLSVIGKGAGLDNEQDIAFQIAPRINAAGRMDSARLPVELFLSDNMQNALGLAQRIDSLNKERKKVQQDIIEQAFEMVENNKKSKTILVLYNQYWHHGIIGIAAGKICEAYRKPVIMLTLKEDGNTIVGSARSVEDIDIYGLIKECSSRLLKFGGHTMAAGLSLRKEDLGLFTQEIENLAERKYFIRDVVQTNADMELGIEMANEKLYERLQSIGPYGEGFELPVFYSENVAVASDRMTDNNHHIMVLEGDSKARTRAVKWFGADSSFEGKTFNITYCIGKNSYGGNSQVQLTVGHMVEARENTVSAFNGMLTDRRGGSAEEIAREFGNSTMFYEGLMSLCAVKGTCSRFEVGRSNTLVFLSTPVNTQLFKEVIMLANPANVVLNFSILPDYTFKGFIVNLMSILKHIINNEGGRTYLENLSVRLCVEEGIIKAALKYIRAAGKIDYVTDTADNLVSLSIGEGAEDNRIHSMEKNLKNALEEKLAYQQFILKLGIEKFGEYLK